MSGRFGTQQPTDMSQLRGSERNSLLPVYKQEVRDERGRKRLHGAFSGGFSAGYFNTVGSKEGWAPNNFLSTKQDRANLTQTALDFMDEEDIADQAKDIGIHNDYNKDQPAHKKARHQMAQQIIRDSGGQSVSKHLVNMFLGPPKDSIGIKLLRQMGWREGQGIGPRKKRSTKESKRDIHAAEQLFAPKDTGLDAQFETTIKRNLFGVGYTPKLGSLFVPASETVDDDSEIHAEQPQKRITGGFGNGVFETEADFDVYDDDDTQFSQFSKKIIVDEDDDDDDTPLLSIPQKNTQKTIQAPPKTLSNEFIPAKRPDTLKFSKYPCKKVPDDWVPMLNPIEYSKKETVDKTSVFAYMSSQTQDHIKQIIQSSKQPHVPPPPPPPVITEIKEDIDAESAKQALEGYIPFESDPAKRGRYVHFLKMKMGMDVGLIKYPDTMKTNEIQHETREFIKSGLMYKPLSSFMSSRFVSSSNPSATQVVPIVPVVEEKKYGKESRRTFAWNPEKLLCKRFDVPYPEIKAVQEKERDVLGSGIMKELVKERDRVQEKQKRVEDEFLDKLLDEQQKDEEEEDQVVDKKKVERPSMDLFKAIFDDSESESDEEEKDDEIVQQQQPVIQPPPPPPPLQEDLTKFKPVFKKKIQRRSNLVPDKKMVVVKEEEKVEEKKIIQPIDIQKHNLTQQEYIVETQVVLPEPVPIEGEKRKVEDKKKVDVKRENRTEDDGRRKDRTEDDGRQKDKKEKKKKKKKKRSRDDYEDDEEVVWVEKVV